MRFLILPAILLASCTPTEPGPVQEYRETYYQSTTICVYRFQDRRDLVAATSCDEGQERVAIGYTVQAIDGDCEPAFMSLHGFRQIWGCQ